MRLFRSSLLCVLLLNIGGYLYGQDYSLIASEYAASKGDTLIYTLYQGRGLDSASIAPEAVDSLHTAFYFQGGKKIDNAIALDSSFKTFVSKEDNTGQSLLMTEFGGGKATYDQLIVEDFAQTENLSDLLPVIDTSGFTTEYTANTFFSTKALVSTERPSGKLHSSKLGHYLEITLQQNPYKMQYGDDMTAIILLNGKPVKGASAIVYTRSPTNQVYSARYRSNDDGKIYFKINRSGLWLVQAVYANPSDEDGVDYNYYQSSYSFSFR